MASFQALMGFVGTNKQALKEAAGSTASGRRGFQEGRSHFSSHLSMAFATCMPNLVHSGRSLLTRPSCSMLPGSRLCTEAWASWHGAMLRGKARPKGWQSQSVSVLGTHGGPAAVEPGRAEPARALHT